MLTDPRTLFQLRPEPLATGPMSEFFVSPTAAGGGRVVVKVLASSAVGIFVSKRAGWGTAAVLIAKSIHDNGTVKCENPECGSWFRIRT